MRAAVSLPNVGDPAQLVRLAVEAEEAGWDGVFLWDHVHLMRVLRLDVHDPWVVLGAIALATERVRLGTLVTPVARRQPWELAKQVTTLDHLSGGRVVLGVGLGEPGLDEFAAFGLPSAPKERAALLDEGLDVVTGLWSGPLAHGKANYSIDAELLPLPVQRPRPPIWVAGLWPNRAPLRRAQRWDGVVPLSPSGQPFGPDTLAEVLAVTGRRDGWDVVVTAAPGVPWDEYAEAGATWMVESAWPDGNWFAELRSRVLEGPAHRR